MKELFLLRVQEEFDVQRKNFKILHSCFSFYMMEKIKNILTSAYL